jgi:hypothetical protein
VIEASEIDWQRYMRPEDRARIVPAEALAERAKARLMLGAEQEEGYACRGKRRTAKS